MDVALSPNSKQHRTVFWLTADDAEVNRLGNYPHRLLVGGVPFLTAVIHQYSSRFSRTRVVRITRRMPFTENHFVQDVYWCQKTRSAWKKVSTFEYDSQRAVRLGLLELNWYLVIIGWWHNTPIYWRFFVSTTSVWGLDCVWLFYSIRLKCSGWGSTNFDVMLTGLVSIREISDCLNCKAIMLSL